MIWPGSSGGGAAGEGAFLAVSPMTLPIELVFVRHGQSEANVVQKREKDIDAAIAKGETMFRRFPRPSPSSAAMTPNSGSPWTGGRR